MSAEQRGIELVIFLFVAVLALAGVARRLAIPYPILLVVGGLLLGFVPGLPTVQLDPDLVFFVFLPPILWSAAYFTSFRDFRANLRPISLHAIGLVLTTTAVVAAVAHAAIPGMGWPAAVALGAIVSPPDAVAATAVLRQLKIPHRVVVILEGESLVNDATALVLYRTAVIAMVTGSFSLRDTVGQFVLAGVGGVAVGLVVGWICRRALHWTNESVSEIAITLLAPYIAWAAAGQVHTSPVLACVTGALYVRRHFSSAVSPATRLQARAVWDLVVFALNGVIFILIGLQLRTLVHPAEGERLVRLLLLGLLVSLAAIVTRLLWVPIATVIPRLSPSLRRRDPLPPWGAVFLLSWAGMRGIVSLAAALALPLTTADGRPLPLREEMVLLTFVVILVTLVVQGLTLGPFVRRLGLPADTTIEREAAHAREQATAAALARLDRIAGSGNEDLAGLRRHYEQRARTAREQQAGAAPSSSLADAAFKRARYETLTAERKALIGLRDGGIIGDEVLLELERDLDLEAARHGLADIRSHGGG